MKTSQKSKKSIDLGSYATGEVGGFAAQLFRIAAHNPLRPIVARLPANGMPIIKELYQGKAPEIARVEEPVIVRREVSQDRGLVAFSGGKDSTAVAIKMVQQGISTELFNVSGINPSFSTYQGLIQPTRRKLRRREVWLGSLASKCPCCP
jgi:hypothetical protein